MYKYFKGDDFCKQFVRKLFAFQHFDINSIPIRNHHGEKVQFDRKERMIPETVLKLVKDIPEKATNPEKDMRFQQYKQETPVSKIVEELIG